jgi:alanine racemase
MKLSHSYSLAIEEELIPPHKTMALIVDLEAIIHNYRLTKTFIGERCDIAGVIKADAYGAGMKPIAQALWRQGCRSFFVAFLDEGIELRKSLPQAFIYVLSGVLTNTEEIFIEHDLIPVLVDRGQIDRWRVKAQQLSRLLPAILHVDTGMVRNGLFLREIIAMAQNKQNFHGLNLHYVMSHLASSEDKDHPQNEEQRLNFERVRLMFPGIRGSLSNSAGLTLGRSYHFDLVRPGLGLLGYARPFPFSDKTQPALKALGRVVQINEVSKGQSIGYNATYRCTRPSKLATLGIGYRDGVLWNLSSCGIVWFNSYSAPIVGRISMDFVVVDVTEVPENFVYVGGWATVFNSYETLINLAQQAGTSHYELLTSLGSRYYRHYLNGKEEVC